MLNYEEFQDMVLEQLPDYLPDGYENAKLQINSVTKNNGLKWQGLTVLPEGENVAPTIYLEGYFDQYTDGWPVDVILNRISEVAVSHAKPKGYEDLVSDMREFETIKDRIVMVVVNAEKNEELLKQVPHVFREDLAIIYKIVVDIADGEFSTVTVRNEHMESWGASVDEIHENAMANTRELLPIKVKSMNEVVREMFERDGLDPELCEVAFNKQAMQEEMFVISNQLNIQGAANIFYDDVLSDLAERFGTDLYILPSSIHECIVVSSKTASPEELAMMVMEVNECDVEEEQQLSNHVYFFDAQKKTLSLADTTVEELGLKAAEGGQGYSAKTENNEASRPRKSR